MKIFIGALARTRTRTAKLYRWYSEERGRLWSNRRDSAGERWRTRDEALKGSGTRLSALPRDLTLIVLQSSLFFLRRSGTSHVGEPTGTTSLPEKDHRGAALVLSLMGRFSRKGRKGKKEKRERACTLFAPFTPLSRGIFAHISQRCNLPRRSRGRVYTGATKTHFSAR